MSWESTLESNGLIQWDHGSPKSTSMVNSGNNSPTQTLLPRQRFRGHRKNSWISLDLDELIELRARQR